jgi:hypothetical protein
MFLLLYGGGIKNSKATIAAYHLNDTQATKM